MVDKLDKIIVNFSLSSVYKHMIYHTNKSFILTQTAMYNRLFPYTVWAKLMVLGAYIRTVSWLTWVITHYIHAWLVHYWLHLNCSIFLPRVTSDSALQSHWVYIGQNSSFLMVFGDFRIDSDWFRTSKYLESA